MKKILMALLLLTVSFRLFAANNSKEEHSSAGMEFGIGSGYVFYGDRATKDLVSRMNSDNFSRAIIGGDVGFFIPIAEPVLFTCEAEVMSDLFWKGGDRCFFFDYAFNGGLKLYPGLGGLGFGMAYSLGRRSQIKKIDSGKTTYDSTGWGNGFKFSVDYDIRYGKTGCCPVVGTYWRHMPRGGSSSDNTLSVYFKLMFR